jgi:mono/diheme cytochrome c family protein
MNAPALPSRWKRIALVTLGTALAIPALFLTFTHFSALSKMGHHVSVTPAPLAIPENDPAAIHRGRYLVDHLMGCKECHGPDLGGKLVMDNGAMGQWYATNLTKGSGSRTADFSPTDWARALRHGVGKDGRRLLLMPSEDYVALSDADIGSVIAYVLSLPPVNRPHQPIHLGPIAKGLIATGKIAFAYDKINHSAKPPAATEGPTRDWGAVLIGSCTGCHGPNLSGGKIPGGDPKWPDAANISPDKSSGIGSWSFDQFSTAMRTGKRPDGSDVRAPMPWQAYAGMKPDDLTAIWQYIQSAPPTPKGNR